MRFGRATVADGAFEAAAYRLLLADNKQLALRGSSFAASKADLQILIRIFLLQRAEDRRWSAGLYFHDSYQRSRDIMSLDSFPARTRYHGLPNLHLPF